MASAGRGSARAVPGPPQTAAAARKIRQNCQNRKNSAFPPASLPGKNEFNAFVPDFETAQTWSYVSIIAPRLGQLAAVQVPERIDIMFIRRAIFGAIAAALFMPALAASSWAEEPAAAPKAEEKPVITRFGTWSTRCEKGEKKGELINCHAFVDVRAGEKKERVLYIGIGSVPKKKDEFFAFAMTPLGTVLPPGIGMAVDEKTKFGGPFVFCAPIGCQAEILLSAEQIKALKNGKQMEAEFKLIGQGDVKIPIKLDGLSKALASLPKPAKGE